MKILPRLILVFFLAAFLAGAATEAQARSNVFIGGSVGFGGYGPGWGWYDPWWYGPPYYYYEPPPNYGYLKTKVEPENAEVWVDNRFFGIADDFNGWFQNLKLPLGIHTAQIRLKGYKSYTISFTVTPGDTTKIEKELSPAEAGEEEIADLGTLRIIAPPGSDIFIDEIYSGTISGQWGRNGVSFPLPPGRHNLRVSKEGYDDKIDVLLLPDQAVSVNAEMKKAGE